MKKFKKAISLILAVFALNAVSPECFFACGAAAYDGVTSSIGKIASYGNTGSVTVKTGAEFYSAVSELLENDEDLFSEVVIDIKENSIKVDDAEEKDLAAYGLNYNDLDTAETLIPVVAVLCETGTPAVYDEKSGEIVVSGEESGSFLLCEKPEVYGDADAKNTLGLATVQETEEELLYETDFNDGKIILTAPCQTARLTVRTAHGGKLKKFCNAETVISDGEDLYVLQYGSAGEANRAYTAFLQDPAVKTVSFDKVVRSSAVQQCNGNEVIQSERFKSYLKDREKTAPVTVAVLDTGVDASHEMLADRMIKGYNSVDHSDCTDDDHGHGTHVAGIIAANTNDNVRIMPVKVLDKSGNGTELSVSLGVRYAADNGADVINMSLGGKCSDENCEIEAAAKYAVTKGVSVCVSAGNSNADTAGYCPAKVHECITVASGSLNGCYTSYFSNYGDAVDITAPGENIRSAKAGGGYIDMSGTSMASPFVAAAAALLLTEEPGLAPAEVESRVKQYASDMLVKGNDRYSGAGYLNFGIFFGDNITATSISGKTGSLSLVYYNGATGYHFPISIYAKGKAIPTDRTFRFTSDAPETVTYDGLKIYAKKHGTAKLHFSLENAESFSCKVSVLGDELWINYASEGYAGGDGSEQSPYLISNAEELSRFALDSRNGESFENKYLKLTDDIDLSGKYWVSTAIFKGNFDGNDHKIINLTGYDPTLLSKVTDADNTLKKNNNGFIHETYGASISDLGLENVYYTSVKSGPLVYHVSQGSTIKNCYTTGFSRGYGLFCDLTNYNIVVSNCYSSATVAKAGIARILYSSLVPDPAIITNTFFCGEIISSDDTEKPSRFLYRAEAFSPSNQTAAINCFSVVKGLSNAYFVEENMDSLFKNCYFNGSRFNITKSGSGEGIESREDSVFRTRSFYTDEENWSREHLWDFENVWAISPGINNGYPYLKKNVPLDKTDNATTGTWLDYAADSFEDGNGTQEEPYLIKTAQQLARLSYLYRFGGGADTYFKLIDDIELYAYEWFPIGAGSKVQNNTASSDHYQFYGNIDGNGHTLKGLNFNKPEARGIAFICNSANNCIKNLHFTDVELKAKNMMCAVIAYDLRFYARIENCSVYGEGTGAGGNIAYNVLPSATVSGCSVSDKTRGCIAFSNEGTVKRCTHSGPSSMIRTQNGGTVKDCLSERGRLFELYSGGEVARSVSVCNKCVFLHDCLNENEGVSATAEQLKDPAFFAGWDFETVWILDTEKGYPVLRGNGEYYNEEKLPTESWEDVADDDLPGYGTKEEPYLIATPQQLAGSMHLLSRGGYFKLIRDIDLSGKIWPSRYASSGIEAEFDFDGNNKTVSNLTMRNGCGLFGTVLISKGNISNITIKNIIGNSVSGIVKHNAGSIKNCHVYADIGIASYINSVVKYADYSGGICEINDGSIENCSYIGSVTGEKRSGGICGYNDSLIKNCYVGGVLNSLSQSAVSGAYTLSAVEENCIVTARYIGKNSRLFGTEEMKERKYYEGYDFENIWDIDSDKNNGYPFLRRTDSRKIDYVLNGGILPPYCVTDFIPGIGTDLPQPLKEGFAFGGWYYDEALENKAEKIDEACCGDVTLYAKWVPGYCIRFHSVRAYYSMESISCPTGERITLPKAKLISNCHGTFDGWSTQKDADKLFDDGACIKDIAKPGETVDLYPVWKNEVFFIKYNFNGNEEPSVLIDFNTGKTVNFLYKPSKAKNGYYFAGWSKTPDGDVFLRYDQPLTGRAGDDYMTELFAVWKEIRNYTVSFDAQGGIGTMPDTVYTNDPAGSAGGGANVPLNNLFYRQGYEFTGWASEKGGKVIYPNGVKKGSLDYSAGNVTLYAVWTPNRYTVAFAANGGKGKMGKLTATYAKSEALPNCTFTAPKGYHFGGWATEKDGACKYKNKQTVKSLCDENGAKITLYAVWTPNRYTVAFAANGGKGKMGKLTATYAKSEALPDCAFTAPKGYHFGGWATEKDGACKYKNKQTVKSLCDENGAKITLYAVWTPNRYTVAFAANGGKGKMGKLTATYAKSEALPDCTFTAPKGYRFAGWSKSVNGKVAYKNAVTVKNLSSVNKAKVKLYAVWEKYDYTVKFNANGANGKMKTLYLKKGEAVSLKNGFTAPKGKHFAGWSESKNGKVRYSGKKSMKDLTKGRAVTLYAVWKANSYTVHFNRGKGSGTMKNVEAVYGKSFTLPKNRFVAPKGYKFEGWSKSKNGKAVYKNAASVKNLTSKQKGTVELYAVWKKVRH